MIIPEDNQKVCFVKVLLLANQFQTKLDKYTGELTLKQWLLLCMLNSMEDEEVTVNDLAAVMEYTRQNTKKIVDILVGKGYVVLHRSSTDRRAYNIKLTQKSYDFFKSFNDQGDKILEDLFQGISKQELAIVVKGLIQIGENLNAL